MSKQIRYSSEFRERAVRMLLDQQGEYESQWAAMNSIAAKVGCTAETLRKWVRQTEQDLGIRNGVTSDERERLKELEKEVRELQRLLESGRYLSIRYNERLADVGMESSVGSKGDSFDNALAETINGLYKTEMIHKRGPWRSVDEVE